MSRDPKLYLGDILTCIDKILSWTEGLTIDLFESDEMVFDAVLRNLEIMGEAVKGLPLEITEANPHLDWRAMSDFRNRLAHGYFAVDTDIVWKVIVNRLPGMREDLARILAGLR